MPESISKGTPGSGAWTAAAILGLALVGVLKRQQLTAAQPTGARPLARTAADTSGGGKAKGDKTEGSGTGGGTGADAKPGTSGTATTHPPGVIGVARSVFDRFGRDNISLVAAGVAFYVLLSIFPALAAMVSLYALVGNPDDVANRITEYGYLLPPEALKLITDGLHNFAKTAGSTLSWALATSVLLALWSARAGISSIMTGLNIAYEEVETRSFINQTLVALGLTVGAILFAVFVILAVAVVPIALTFLSLSGIESSLKTVIDLARWPVLAILVAIGFAVIYRYGPSRKTSSWRWISWGSGIATLLWLVGSFGFSIYVSKFGSYDATYGALGAVVVLLLWLWVSALVLLVGAEIDGELDQRATLTGSPTSPLPAGTPKP